MSEFGNRWLCKEKDIRGLDSKIFSKLNISPVLGKLLLNRNINTEQKISSFLKPSLKYLHDPKLLPGIGKAIKRVKKAIAKDENILIFGDYDTDGIISSVILSDFLEKLNLNVDIYIPNRFEEGYDISIDFVKSISRKKYQNLIICVDCGTNSMEVRDYILNKQNNLDVIACDHHQPSHLLELKDGEAGCNKDTSNQKESNSSQYIIINPKLNKSIYPFKHLSGAGVTFKFITAILRELDEDLKFRFDKNYLTSLLDLVAISTIADIMPLVDENRIMVKKGLLLLKNTTNIGLKKITKTLIKNKPEINAYDVGFVIAPRINAEGRLANAKNAVELLKTKKEDEKSGKLDVTVEKLNSFNQRRQEIQKKILTEILDNNNFDQIVAEQKIYIDSSPCWNEGVLGVVASNLVEKFNIPVILFKEKKDKLKGSGRSTDSFSLYENLLLLKDFFDKFGGHEKACGITMDKLNYNKFKTEMIKIANSKIKNCDVKKNFYYDLEIDFKHLNSRLIRELKLLHPFGIGNPKPVFITKNCKVIDTNFLKDERHVKLKLKNNNILFDAVMFGIDENIKRELKLKTNVDILYTIEERFWSNQNTIQLVVLDLMAA